MEQEETTRRENKIKNSSREEITVLMIWWVEQWKSKNYQSTKDKVSSRSFIDCIISSCSSVSNDSSWFCSTN